MSFLAKLQPYDVHSKKIRIGPPVDGGYVLPEIVLDQCSALFTYGVGGDTRFEEEFSKIYNKPAYLFDHTVGTPHLATIDSNITFKPEGLGFGEKCKDFLEHYNEFNIQQDVFLKIDIEGGEFDYFLNCDIAGIASKTTGLNIEFHWIDNLELRNKFEQILDKLNEHFVLSHLHGNNWAERFPLDGHMVPIVMELTFVNRKYVQQAEPDCQKYPIEGLDYPNRHNAKDYDLTFLYWSPKANQKIYISLTTVPERLNNWDIAKQNLESLLHQNTLCEYSVILNIPYVYKMDNIEYTILPELLQFAQDNPRLIINRVSEDLGPIVKITGALQVSQNPNDVLIVCDDDHIYHEDMLEYHLKKLIEYPDTAIGFHGDLIVEKRSWVEDGVKKYVLFPFTTYFPVKNDVQVMIPGHWHSVSYRRKFFDTDFLTPEVLGVCENDDYLVGYYFKKKHIPIMMVAWDRETDFRPVNYHGDGKHFPIKSRLPIESDTGFTRFRNRTGDHHGVMTDEWKSVMHNSELVTYTEI